MLRSIKLKQQIIKELPDIVILIETNLEDDWDADNRVYASFRTENASDGGICIIAKKLLCPKLVHRWSKYALAIKCQAVDVTIMGLYTPYKELQEDVEEFIQKYKKGKWIAFGDHENEVRKFAAIGPEKFIPKMSRERNGNFYVTDAFYGNIKMHGRIKNLISDHYLLQIDIPDQYKVQANVQKSITRADIIRWATSNSKMRKELLEQWPRTTLSIIAHKYIKPRVKKMKVWIINGVESWDHAMLKQWIIRRRKRVKEDIKQCVLEGNMEGLASKLKKFWNRMKMFSIVNQVTAENGTIAQGQESATIVAEYFRKLYTANKKVHYSLTKGDTITRGDAENAIARVSRGKALSIDEFPDELMDDPDIRKIAALWIQRKACGEAIEEEYLTGKLMLINKSKETAPRMEQTRGITILSALYKACELAWLEKYGELVWKAIGGWQVGFRKGYGTHVLVAKLKRWIEENKKNATVIFVDVHKAFDSISREDVYKELRRCGIPEEGIQWYQRLVTVMYVSIGSIKVAYDKGVPQGSILSPMMFALVFDKILREANYSGWKLLAYADDVAICLKNKKEYQNAIEWLTTWRAKANLDINKAKTVEMRFGKMKKQIGKFRVVTEFKYLGVYIHDTYRAKCARTRLLKQADEYRVKAERAKHTNVGAAKIGWIWWTVTKILYAAVSDVALGWLEPGKVEEICIKAARKTYGITKGISNEFTSDFLELPIKQTLMRMAEKVRQKLGENLCIRPRIREEWRRQWMTIATRNDLQINQVWRWKSQALWNKEGKLRCKVCGGIANLLHLQEHCKFDPRVSIFIHLLKEKGVKAIVEFSKTHGEAACDETIAQVKKYYCRMMETGKFVHDIFRISRAGNAPVVAQCLPCNARDRRSQTVSYNA
eukprot:TRINITY_DN2234_c0_g1_i5.p1 TRINITY_DN2234_c0_g1~~TRINITY_DN2234_c0_g1_i5.p1  ORF type:complete len:888 (-),score=89.93 TRINITY_DN2234_c0_g1_i5:726-3389(-)